MCEMFDANSNLQLHVISFNFLIYFTSALAGSKQYLLVVQTAPHP